MKRRLLHIMEAKRTRHGSLVVAAVLVCTMFLGSLIACTTYTPPQWIDGKLDMGALFDHVLIDHKTVRVRGLSQDMTPQDVMDYYGLKAEDTEVVTNENGDRKTILIPCNALLFLKKNETILGRSISTLTAKLIVCFV